MAGPNHQISPDQPNRYSIGVNPFESLSPAPVPQGKRHSSSALGRPSGAYEDKKPRISELDNDLSKRPLSETTPNKTPALSRGSITSQRDNSHSSRPSETKRQMQPPPSSAASQPQTPGSSNSRKRKRNKKSGPNKSSEAAGSNSQSSSQQLPEADWARTPGSGSSFPTEWPSSPPAFFSSQVHSAETPTSKFNLKTEYELPSFDTPGSTRSDSGKKTSRPGHIYFDEENWGNTPSDFRFPSGSSYGDTPQSAQYSEEAFDRAPTSPCVEIISISSSPGPKTPKTPYAGAARKIPSIETADMASAKKPPHADERVAVLESRVAALTSELKSVRAQMYQGVVKWWPASKADSNGSKPEGQKQDRSSQGRKSQSRRASQQVHDRR